MLAATKPDFERAKETWRLFWHGEVGKRPPVVTSVPRPGCDPVDVFSRRYYRALTGQWDEALSLLDRWIENTEFLAEAIPVAWPDLGPDQFAAALGGKLRFSETSQETNWIEPWVTDWEDVLPITLSDANATWRKWRAYARRLAEHGQDRYLVGVCDLHSNMDTLLAMRGAEALSMDFYDCPDLIEAAMRDVRKLYRPVYEALYKASRMGGEAGCIGWIPFWCDGRFAVVQCDYLCMLSPEMSRRFILPALEEEASSLDHCVLHFDGPGALPHLDDVLSIGAIDCIQWVSGAGQPPMHTWADVLARCQAAGKSLDIYGVCPDDVKALHPQLKPNLVAYRVDVETRAEAEDLLKALENNT